MKKRAASLPEELDQAQSKKETQPVECSKLVGINGMTAGYNLGMPRAPLEPASLALETTHESSSSPLGLQITAPRAVMPGDIEMEALEPWCLPYRMVRVAVRFPPEYIYLTAAIWYSAIDCVLCNMTSTASLNVPIEVSTTTSDALTLQTLVRVAQDYARNGRCVLIEIPVPAGITLYPGAAIALSVSFAGADLTLRIPAAGHIHSPRCNHAIGLVGDVWRASNTNDTAALEAALAAGGSTEETSMGAGSALAVAAMRGCVEAFHILLAAGADVNAHDKDGLTALHNAARLGRMPIVQALLRDARVNPGERDSVSRVAEGLSKIAEVTLAVGRGLNLWPVLMQTGLWHVF